MAEGEKLDIRKVSRYPENLMLVKVRNKGASLLPPLQKQLKPDFYAGKISLHRLSDMRNPNMILFFLLSRPLQVKPL